MIIDFNFLLYLCILYRSKISVWQEYGKNMARMVILNKDLVRSQRCKKKHKGHCTWMHSGRVWNTIYEFMEYSGYSFLTVYELKKKGILTIKDRKEKR